MAHGRSGSQDSTTTITQQILQIRGDIVNVVQDRNFSLFWLTSYYTLGTSNAKRILPIICSTHLYIVPVLLSSTLFHCRFVQLPVPNSWRPSIVLNCIVLHRLIRMSLILIAICEKNLFGSYLPDGKSFLKNAMIISRASCADVKPPFSYSHNI